jgi:hypothetical protein
LFLRLGVDTKVFVPVSNRKSRTKDTRGLINVQPTKKGGQRHYIMHKNYQFVNL